MAIIARPNVYVPATLILSAEVNADFDTIYADYNGNINADNLDLTDIYIWSGAHTHTAVTTFTNDIRLSSTRRLYLDGGSDTYIYESAANVFDLYVGATNYIKVTHSSGLINLNANVNISGSQTINITDVNAATYDLQPEDYILNVSYTGTGAVTSLTLPTAQCLDGRVIHIKDAGGNASIYNITIDTEGAETIDGKNEFKIMTDRDSVTLYAYNGNWFVY